jgi:hypothetical protein
MVSQPGPFAAGIRVQAVCCCQGRCCVDHEMIQKDQPSIRDSECDAEKGFASFRFRP